MDEKLQSKFEYANFAEHFIIFQTFMYFLFGQWFNYFRDLKVYIK